MASRALILSPRRLSKASRRRSSRTARQTARRTVRSARARVTSPVVGGAVSGEVRWGGRHEADATGGGHGPARSFVQPAIRQRPPVAVGRQKGGSARGGRFQWRPARRTRRKRLRRSGKAPTLSRFHVDGQGGVPRRSVHRRVVRERREERVLAAHAAQQAAPERVVALGEHQVAVTFNHDPRAAVHLGVELPRSPAGVSDEEANVVSRSTSPRSMPSRSSSKAPPQKTPSSTGSARPDRSCRTGGDSGACPSGPARRATARRRTGAPQRRPRRASARTGG